MFVTDGGKEKGGREDDNEDDSVAGTKDHQLEDNVDVPCTAKRHNAEEEEEEEGEGRRAGIDVGNKEQVFGIQGGRKNVEIGEAGRRSAGWAPGDANVDHEPWPKR